MKNITFETKGNSLVITIDLTAKGELSRSGKSYVIASTEGNQEVGKTPDGLRVYAGVNAYYFAPRK